MKITPREAMLLGIWGEVASAKDINVWAVKEGQIERDEELTVTAEQIKLWLA